MITLTPKAQEKVRGFMAEEENPAKKALRVFVEGGGCSGFQYGLSIDEPKDGDVVVDCDGFKIVVDQQSSLYLQGCSVDYVEGFQGAGFKIENPQAKGSCGCGKSFTV